MSKFGCSALNQAVQILHRAAVLDLQAVILQHVAQRRQQILGLQRRPLRLRGAFAFDDVAAAGSADVHQLLALQLLDKIGKARSAVRAFVERGIQLQHGGFQQPELRLHGAPFEHLQRAFHQRHRLRQFERSRTLPPISTLRPVTRGPVAAAGAAVGCCCRGSLPQAATPPAHPPSAIRS